MKQVLIRSFASFFMVTGLVAAAEAPLTIYSGERYSGEAVDLAGFAVLSGDDIPKMIGQNAVSMILRKGHSVCIGTEKTGEGMSKVIIAGTRDVKIPLLSDAFREHINFIRISKWREVKKKGFGGRYTGGLNCSWYYMWGGFSDGRDASQWVPMAWGGGWLNPTREKELRKMDNLVQILGFNEPDDCEGQSGQHGDLCKQKVAVEKTKPLARLGLRMGGPGLRESGPFTWLPEYMKHAEKQGVRIDFVAVHWYDWEGVWQENQARKAGDEARIAEIRSVENIFARFKRYIHTVHEKYGLPIWITEFNCNPGREESLQIEFMKRAMPWLDEQDFVERYAYFQPFGGSGDFHEVRNDPDSPLTAMGRLYRDHESVPALKDGVWLGANNLTGPEIEE